MSPAFPLQIFYDGGCRVCSAEMDHYRKHNPQERLQFVDIAASDFVAEDYSRTRTEFMKHLHVRDAGGVFYTGIEAFMAIWQAYPGGSLYRVLGRLLGFPVINQLSRCGYWVFARYRHLLPKRDSDCESGTCNLGHSGRD